MVDATPRAFVSYARSDATFVLKVAQQLRRQGCKVWVDQLDIPKGARWDEAVEGALRASACLMVVLSPASVKSQNVLDEVAFALDERRPVLPILLQPVAVPFRLKRLQYIDFTGDYDAAFEQLVAALDALAQPQPQQIHDAPPAVAAAPAEAERVAAPAPTAVPAPPPVPAPSRAAAPASPQAAPAAGASASARPGMAGAAVMPSARPRPLGLMGAAAAAAVGLAVLVYVLLPRDPPPQTAAPEPAPAAAAPLPEPRRDTVAASAETPAPPAAAAVLDDQRIRGFVADYIAALNRVDAEALLAFYAQRVDYFDFPGVGHDFILKDKQAFHRRWPVIENRLASDISIDRSAGDGSARVSYTIRYRVSSAQRADSKSGAARDVLVLRLVQDRPLIVAQRQQPLAERAAN